MHYPYTARLERALRSFAPPHPAPSPLRKHEVREEDGQTGIVLTQGERFLRAAGAPQAPQGLRNLFYCRLFRKQTR